MKYPILPVLVLSLSALVASASEPKANWSELCAKCHGEDGRGQTKMGKKLKIPDLSTKAVQHLFTDEQAFKIIKEGVKDDQEKVSMKAVEGLSDEEIRALVPVVRSLLKP